jgi:hypothetical protein
MRANVPFKKIQRRQKLLVMAMGLLLSTGLVGLVKKEKGSGPSRIRPILEEVVKMQKPVSLKLHHVLKAYGLYRQFDLLSSKDTLNCEDSLALIHLDQSLNSLLLP